MKVLAFDSENTTWSTGSPFDSRNWNVCISYKDEEGSGVLFGDDRTQIADRISRAELLIGFNLKYDLHWLRRLGIDFGGKRVWCCQVAEFILSRQERRYPSLEDAAMRYELGHKQDLVKGYWDRGINTHEIPRAVLEEYALQDAELTWAIYHKQQSLIKPSQRVLMSVDMQDLLVLEEMEWNGLSYDFDSAREKTKDYEAEISRIQAELGFYHNVPNFNWGSAVHLSALLYGGTIKDTVKEPAGIFKTGNRAGQVKFANREVEYKLPRMYAPIRGSKLAREGQYSVDESFLVQLQGDKKLITGLLRIKELNKLVGTYLRGLEEKHVESHQEKGIIHGQFNQVVASTGRLSSSNPNLQNNPEDTNEFFTSRFPSTN